jgi:SAM-dependent methyltransferase
MHCDWTMIRPTRLLVVLLCVVAAAAAAFAFQAYRANAILEAANRAVAAAPAKAVCQKVRPSALAKKYLDELHGVEIGASTQNSFDLKRSINVDFSDEQGGLWQHKDCPPAVVNIVALGDDLPFKDGSLDYVVSAHVIEHFFDPVKALKEWYRVIRPGGYIFIIVPHRDRTFDKGREVTPVAELIDRSTGRLKVQDYARPADPKARTEAMPQKLLRDKAALEPGWAWFTEDDHHHWSVWRTQDFVDLVKHLKFKVVEVQDVDDKYGNGFTVVIQKPPR